MCSVFEFELSLSRNSMNPYYQDTTDCIETILIFPRKKQKTFKILPFMKAWEKLKQLWKDTFSFWGFCCCCCCAVQKQFDVGTCNMQDVCIRLEGRKHQNRYWYPLLVIVLHVPQRLRLVFLQLSSFFQVFCFQYLGPIYSYQCESPFLFSGCI